MTQLLPHEEKHHWAIRVTTFIAHNLSDIFSWGAAAATIALAVMAFLDNVHFGWVIAVAAFAVASTILAQTFKKKHRLTVRQAEKEARTLWENQEYALDRMHAVVNQLAKDWVVQCGVENDHTRVTVYQHDPAREMFIPTGRASGNPELEKRGRPEYPDSSGIIRNAWFKGEATEFRLSSDPTEWAETQNRKYDVPLEVAHRIRMKSRSYIGLRFDYGPNGDKVGIAIFESLKPHGVTNKLADTARSSGPFEQLALALAVGPRPPLNSRE